MIPVSGSRRSRPSVPPRIVLAAVVSVVALAALGLSSLWPSGDGDGAGEAGNTSSTTTSSVDTTLTSAPTTTIELAPDWYEKASSRYSDRVPSVTVSTLDPTTTTTARSRSQSGSQSGSGSGSGSSGRSGTN